MATLTSRTSPTPSTVVAIDFGTSRTGFAYAFVSDDGGVPEVFKKVYPNDGYHKQPTCLYVDMKTTELLAFGHEAHQLAAHDKSSGDDCSNRFLFASFKQGLDAENTTSGEKMWPSLDNNTRVDDFEVLFKVAELPVQKLIAMTLKYVKDELIDYVKSRDGIQLDVDQVRWVITLPAIWSEPAKQVMKDAACDAGLIRSAASTNSNIILALEPEAAILGASREANTLLTKMVGQTVMVADNGGGTVDVCAVVVESTNPFKCRHAVESAGGWWGATTVDDELEKFLKAILGPELFESYMAAPVQRLSMLSAWESYKKTFKLATSAPFDCRLDFLEEPDHEDVDLRRIVSTFSDESFGPTTDLSARAYVIKIPVSFVQLFFKVSLTKIVEHLREQSAKVAASSQPPVNCILLAGGFSESPYLQEVIEDAFESQIVISHSAGSNIQTGAVMYGLAPDTITSRVMRYTFGYAISSKLDRFRSDHGALSIPEEYTFYHEETGEEYVHSGFCKFVEKGETVNFSNDISCGVQALYKSHNQVSIKIYYTAKSTVPIFVDEPLVKRIGTFTVEVGDTKNKNVSLNFRFGSTSLEVTATAASTGEEIKVDLAMPK